MRTGATHERVLPRGVGRVAVVGFVAVVAAGPGSGLALDPPPAVRVVAASGARPDGGTPAVGFGRPSSNRRGDLAFPVRTGDGGGWSEVWKAAGGGLEVVARAGQEVTRFPHGGAWVETAKFAAFDPPLMGGDGRVYFSGRLQPGLGSSDVYYDECFWVEGDLAAEAWLLARESVESYVGFDESGVPQLGEPARWMDRFSVPVLAGGQGAVLVSRLRAELNPSNREHMSALQVAPVPGGVLAQRPRPLPLELGGGAAAGLPGWRFRAFEEVAASGGDDGALVFVGVVEDQNPSSGATREGVWVTRPGDEPRLVAAAGATLPAPWGAGRFDRFASPVVNDRGDVVFWASGTGGIEGVWRSGGPGAAPLPVLVSGQSLPGLFGSSVTAVGNPGLDAAGNAVVRARVRTLLGETEGVWRFWHSGGSALVAIAGEETPGAGEERFTAFADPLVSGAGHIVLAARFAAASGAVGQAAAELEESGCFLFDRDGVLKPVVLTGRGFELDAGDVRVVDGFELGIPGDGGAFGVTAHFGDSTSAVLRVEPVDGTPPATPGGLRARWVDLTEVEVTWERVSGDAGVTGYRVFQDGQVVGEVGTGESAMAVTGLAPGSSYQFSVVAVDVAGNVSAPSAPAVVALPVEGQAFVVDDRDAGFSSSGSWPDPPRTSAYAGRHRTTTEAGAQAIWTFSPPVAGAYRVDVHLGFGANDRAAAYSLAGGLSGPVERVLNQQFTASRWNRLGVVRLEPGTASTVTLTRTGESPYGTVADATRWTLLVEDSTPPSPPRDLVARWRSATEAALDWEDAGDNTGVWGYVVAVAGEDVATVRERSVEVAGLEPGRLYVLSVRARDFAGLDSVSREVVLQMPSFGAGTVIDDGELGFSTTGGWNLSDDFTATGGRRRSTGSTGSTATWEFVPAVSGLFEVGVSIGRLPGDHSAPYRITSGGTVLAVVTLDQNSVDPDGWLSVGTFQLTAGVAASVRVTRQADDPVYTVADAARFRPLVEDAAAPGAPPGVVARRVGASAVELEWGAASDDLGVAAYVVIRDGDEIGRASGTGFSDRDPVAGARHVYTVVAEDTAGRRSGGSVPVPVVVPSAAAGPVEIVDDPAPGVSRSAGWWLSDEPGVYGSGARFSTTPGAWVEWAPELPGGGVYEVFARHPVGQFDRGAVFEVHHAGGSDAVTVDQTTGGGEWISLGSYRFRGGGSDRVRLEVSGSDFRPTVADALRFVPLDVQQELAVVGTEAGPFPGSLAIEIESRWGAFDAPGPRALAVEFQKPGAPTVHGLGLAVESGSRLQTLIPKVSVPSELGFYDVVLTTPADGTVVAEGAVALGPPEEDRDGDGVPTLVELATGGDPDVADQGGAGQPPAGLEVAAGAGGEPVFRYRRRAVGGSPAEGGTDGTGVRAGPFVYRIEVWDRLRGWGPAGALALEQLRPVGGGMVEVTLRGGGALGRAGGLGGGGFMARLAVQFVGAPAPD